MKGNVAALVIVGILAIGFYVLLSSGGGQALSSAIVGSSVRASVVATSTPGVQVRLPPLPTATPTPMPQPVVPVAQPENRSDCNAIRGTPYRSDEERSWYLENCVSSTNRADCNRIRGTRYLSLVERNWYLANCLR